MLYQNLFNMKEDRILLKQFNKFKIDVSQKNKQKYAKNSKPKSKHDQWLQEYFSANNLQILKAFIINDYDQYQRLTDVLHPKKRYDQIKYQFFEAVIVAIVLMENHQDMNLIQKSQIVSKVQNILYHDQYGIERHFLRKMETWPFLNIQGFKKQEKKEVNAENENQNEKNVILTKIRENHEKIQRNYQDYLGKIQKICETVKSFRTKVQKNQDVRKIIIAEINKNKSEESEHISKIQNLEQKYS